MSQFDYLVCDGGPHLVLPRSLSANWRGVTSLLDAIGPAGDYGRALAAVANQRMALVGVGSGEAIVLQNPPMSAWGRSPEGWTDLYYLEAWRDQNLDALIGRAISAVPTSGMKDTCKDLHLLEPGLILLFAGDRPGSSAYGEYQISIPAGSYRILEGTYSVGAVEAMTIFRLRPTGI